MWLQDTPLTTPASAGQWQFHLQLHHQVDAGPTSAVALRDHSACLSSLCWPKASPELDSLLLTLGLLALPPGKEKKNGMPTDDKIPQLCLSSLLIPAALSQVELHYSISLSLSLSQHSNYVKYGIKQAKVQKQQWSSVSFHQFCHWQSRPRVHISAVCIFCVSCVSETPSFLVVE